MVHTLGGMLVAGHYDDESKRQQATYKVIRNFKRHFEDLFTNNKQFMINELKQIYCGKDFTDEEYEKHFRLAFFIAMQLLLEYHFTYVEELPQLPGDDP